MRSTMWVKSSNRGMGRFHALFYAAPMTLNFAAGTYGLAISGDAQSWLIVLPAASFTALAYVARQWFRPSAEAQPVERTKAIEEAAADWQRITPRPPTATK